jgi:hypothetical protein
MTTTWNEVLHKIIFDPRFRHAAETHPRELFTRLGLIEPEPTPAAEDAPVAIDTRTAAKVTGIEERVTPQRRSAA